MTNSNFLKKLLTTASVIAVSASAGSAFAEARLVFGGNADQTGLNLDLQRAGAPAGIIAAVTPKSTLTFRTSNSYAIGNAPLANNPTSINVEGNNITAVINSVAGNNFTLDAVTLSGTNSKVNVNLNGGAELTLSGAGTALQGYIANYDKTTAGAPGTINANWAFAAGVNDYTGLGQITFNANNDKVIINSGANLTGVISANVAGNGIVEVKAENVVFNGGLTGQVGVLDVQDGKSATIGANSNVNDIKIGNASTLKIAAGKNITSVNIHGSAADKGVFRFEGASTVAATKIGDVSKLNTFELAGAGLVNLTTTTDFTATKTTFSNDGAVLQFTGPASATALGVALGAAVATTDIETTVDNTGKVIIADDLALLGSIGATNKSLAEVQISNNKTLSFAKDNVKLYATNVTTTVDTQGDLGIGSDNFEIHANIGTGNKKLNSVTIASNAAGAAAATVKLMAGKNITATSVDLAFANFDNILELYEGSSITGNVITTNANKGTLSVNGNSIITGEIGAGGAINQIKFDDAKTLTVTKNALTTNGGVNFAADGTLKLTEDSNTTFNTATTTKAVVGGTGSIAVDQATAGKTVILAAQVGDVAVANNALKLLQVKGGADIQLTNANIAINKIDIGSQDSNLKLNVVAGQFLLGDFTHENNKGTLLLENNATLKTGTKLSANSTNGLKAIVINDKTLTVEDGVNLYTSNGVDGGVRNAAAGAGVINFEGTSIVGAALGNNNSLNEISVQGNDATVTFQNKVNLTNALTIHKGATAVLEGQFIGSDISGDAGGNGTVKFANKAASTIAAEIGNTKLNTVEIAGSDITFEHADFAASNLNFTNAGNTSVTFKALAANELQNTKITTSSTTRQHNATLTANDHQFDQNVGTATHRFGNLKLTGDQTITTTSGGFYAGVINSNKQEGVVVFNNAGVALNLGSVGSELKSVTFNGQTNAFEDIYSKDVIIAAGVTTTFNKLVSSSNSLQMNNGSVATFSGPQANLSAPVTTAVNSQGTVNLVNGASVNNVIGTAALRVQTVNFIGAAGAADFANVNADIASNDINVANQNFRAMKNLTLNASTAFKNGAAVTLGTKTVTLKNGVSRFENATAVNLTLNKNKDAGSFVVDGSAGASTLATNLATGLTVNIADADAMLPVSDETYTLFKAVNGGAIAPFAPGKVTIVSSGNNFVQWSMNGNDLNRKNIATEALTKSLGTADAELLKDAILFTNANNTGNAAAHAADLGRMNGTTLKDSLERSSEVTSIHAGEIARNLMDSSNANVNKRIANFSNHPPKGIQTASSGVSGLASGDDDHTMYGAWASPFYSKTTQSARGSRAGYKSDSYGVTLGFDAQANADLTVGVAGTFAKTDAKFKNFKSGDTSKADTFMFSIYGVQQLTNNWFLQGHAAYASSQMKNTEKRITSTATEFAKANFDVTSYNTELLGGFSYNIESAVVTPLIGASYTRINSSGYTETGTTNQNLTVNSKATNKFEAIAGLTAQTTTEMDGVLITPEIHGFVKHDLIAKSSDTTSKLSGMVNNLTPKSAKALKTTFNFGLGVNAVSGMYEYGAGYDLFAANKTIGHQGTLKVRLNF
jgi:outer membrane autotransporter protein